jgi:hypothetical protein
VSLSDDIIMCKGHFVTVESDTVLHPTCIDCKRYTTKPIASYQWWMQGEVVDGKCEYKIKDKS